MNKELVSKVAAQVEGFSNEDIDAVVREHQNKFPGDWQEWEIARMAPYIVGMLNRAAAKRETAPARIVQYCH